MLLTDVCNAEGYEVLTAADGEAAIDEFRKRDVDLVLLDVAMPKLDGLTVCRMMRDLRPVPVIIVTATNEPRAEAQARDCGAAAYMTKPFRVFELSRKMRALLRPSVPPSEASGNAAQSRRREAARALGTVGGALQLRVALRGALASPDTSAVVFARLENEREILARAGRTARDAVMGSLCGALQSRVSGVDVYCAESNELVALMPEAGFEAAMDAIAKAARAEELGVGIVVIGWTGVRLAPGGGDVDVVLRALRDQTRTEGGSGAGAPGAGEGGAR